MSKFEIADTYASKINAAKRALDNGWIDAARYADLIRRANEWNRKALRGHWDYNGPH
jgi:endonuclease YncB( thermonuclease family)